MRAVWDEEKKLEKMLAVEAALALSLAELGKIPKKDADLIKQKANTKDVKLGRVKEIEKETKHDVMALVKALTEQCGDAGKYVHLTATSYDIVDTAQALQLKEGLDILTKKARILLNTCLDFSFKNKDVVMIGRTHGQHAVPITLGFKFANYADKLGEDIERLEEDSKKYVVGKFSGAVGSYAAQTLYDLGDDLEKTVMKKLGIRAADISTQVVPREHIARILSDIAILSGTIEQMAKEFRNLQRTEIGELSEPFGSKQVGSSTMAQKRNPIDCENICSNVRVIRSCVQPALENIPLEHERDLTNSACERSIIPTAFALTDEILDRMNKVLSGAVVFGDNIRRDLELSKGTIMAEAVITELVKRGMGRQDAHEKLRTASMKAFEGKDDLKDALIADAEIKKYMNKADIEKTMDYRSYAGLCSKKTDQIVKKWRK